MTVGTYEISTAIDRQRLVSAWAAGQKRARALGRPVLVSVTESVPLGDPLALYAAAAISHDRFFWEVPSAGLSIAGAGRAWSSALHDHGRFAQAGREWQALLSDALINGPPVGGTGPLAISGFRFDPETPASAVWAGFPNGLLVAPRLMLTRRGERAWLTLNAYVRPDDDPAERALDVLLQRAAPLLQQRDLLPPASASRPPLLREVIAAHDWQAIVASAVRQMQAGDLEKVVLARAVQAEFSAPISHAHVLDRLRHSYPDCFIFAVGRGARSFLGASPERLVRVQAGEVAVSALAGSIARGTTPEEDARLGAELLASSKDRHEHALVVNTIRSLLAETSPQVVVASEPTLMRMRNVQHLFTPITAQLARGQTPLDLVARLHPTPAVGGLPREAAMALIRAEERLDRGWYAAPVGWIDAHGEGEFAVALRSALLGEQSGTLFAGCGIVADSDPEREYGESQLKLRAVLSALS